MKSREVFSRIARRYDKVNRVLSLGRDGAWRRSALAHLPRLIFHFNRRDYGRLRQLIDVLNSV